MAGLLLATLSQAQEIKLLTEEWSPYQMNVSNIQSGISVDIVNEIKKRVSHKGEIKFYPWNRGYNMTLKKDGYALFSTGRTEEREKLFKWVGPLADLEFVFFKLKSNKKIYATEDDIKAAKAISVTKNDAMEQILTGKGFKNLAVKSGGTHKANLNKLLNGKVELWPSGANVGKYIFKELGIQDKVVAVKAPPFMKLSLNIAFSKNTDDKIIVKWQNALDEIKSDGTYDKILKKYR